ncbi:MAG: flagellar motor switch protein FliG [Nitrospirae bacterium]|nr:flagellar motor switch protein FliG [Nitrospirota bacterium]
MAAGELKGLEKIALLLVAWGDDVSAQILRNLKETEVQDVTLAMSTIQGMRQDVVEKVAREFYEEVRKGQITSSDYNYIRNLLIKSLGEEKAAELMEGLFFADQEARLTILNKLDSKTLLTFLKNEHPQTVAVILANMQANRAAEVLTGLPPELQSDIVKRVAKLERISSDMVKEIDRALHEEFRTGALASAKVGGVPAVAEMLNQVDRAAEEDILAKIEEEDPELAESIRHHMFTFEDLAFIDDRGMQDLMKEVNREDLVKSMKTASEELKEKIFRNMSKRAAEMVKEELSLLGPMRLSDVERAQREIIQVARRLQDEGKIAISKGGEALV